MRICILLFALIVSSVQIGISQEKLGCGYTGTSDWFEYYMANRDNIQVDLPEEPVWVPITCHILGDDNGNGYYSMNNLFPSICQLNEDFLATNIQFYVDDINFIDNERWYDHESFNQGVEMMRANNVPGTVNSYFVQNPAGTCGYFTGSGDAVALSKSCMAPNDHTWAHELGHFFSLPHTFVGWEGTDYQPGNLPGNNRRGIERVERTNCSSTADRFCDTPADYLSYRWTCNGNGESNVIQTDPQGAEFRSDGTLFMSYANDACMTRFSGEQRGAMSANLFTRRSNLLADPTPLEQITEQALPQFPIQGEGVQFDNAVLTWNEAEHATGYLVQASRIPNLSGLFVINEFVTDTFVQLPELDLGRTYYWRVRPFNPFSYCTNFSSRESFTAGALTSSDDLTRLDFSVYPVPVSSDNPAVMVRGLDNDQYEYQLVDLNGKIIQAGSLGQGELQLTTGLKAGVYHLVLQSDEGSGHQKIVIR